MSVLLELRINFIHSHLDIPVTVEAQPCYSRSGAGNAAQLATTPCEGRLHKT
jgi:hypothetical protein